MCMVRRARMRVGKGSRWKMGVRVRHVPNWSDKSAHNHPAHTPQPRPGLVRHTPQK